MPDGSRTLASDGNTPWPKSSTSECSPSTTRYEAPSAPGSSEYEGPAPRTTRSIGGGSAPNPGLSREDAQLVTDLVERRERSIQLLIGVRRRHNRADPDLV